MAYLAHSEQDCIPAQSYAEHVQHVKESAVKFAEAATGGAANYARKDGALLVRCAEKIGEWHDIGKLLAENQEVLHQKNSHSRLPINHADAGAAAFMQARPAADNVPALAICAHHRGLPNIPEEIIKGKDCYRDMENGGKNRRRVDSELESLVKLHREIIDTEAVADIAGPIGDFGVFARMLLSCLADADHTDTAIHYGKYPKNMTSPHLRAEDRLAKLDHFVSQFQVKDERNALRAEMYQACRTSNVTANIAACDSPVGSGKTTAVMAHLLKQAITRKARRVFVVLPFTNIIRQSVDIYREALVLPGEDPTEVVAELHHCADFQSVEARAYTAQWRAPIIVTTAVAFFETIAANRPSALRRLHELPGSVIFVDEAHASLPVKLLPVAWHWMQKLADEWSCYWVLASGSLVEFWKIPEISGTAQNVPQIVDDRLRIRLSAFEKRRIEYPIIEKPLSIEELIVRIKAAPGPRLVIMNTVRSAGVLANRLLGSYGDLPIEQNNVSKVLHLSTALSAEDRSSVIDEVIARLKNKSDIDWTLVATSCVEAGVDFSFRTGFREISSLLSLLQAAGRVGRNGEYEDAAIWSFTMQDDPMLSRNPWTEDSEKVLLSFFRQRFPISPELCTKAIVSEINRGPEEVKQLLKSERRQNYRDVGEEFKVIEGDTVLAIADEDLKQRLHRGHTDWKEIQRKSISIRRNIAKEYRLTELIEGIYDWNLRYDSFLGIIAGTLDVEQAKNGFLNC
ncbi:MAG: CRISPR-associated endonuclease Cas3'' [Oscillospiraceae bacterium]|nr:CRISPR-associated endonuclease Cas3'' [Oscillospiraceae bacterium]